MPQISIGKVYISIKINPVKFSAEWKLIIFTSSIIETVIVQLILFS